MKKIALSGFILFLAACSSSPERSDSEAISTERTPSPVRAKTSKQTSRSNIPAVSVNDVSTGDLHSELKKAYFANDEKSLEEISTKLLALNHDDLKVLNTLGSFRFKQGQLEMARLHWEQALRKNPNESYLYNNLGMIELRYGDEAKALSYFKEAIRKNNNNASASANVGIIYLKYRNYKSALAALELAYESDSNSASIANHYALALRGTGQQEKALSILDQAIKKNPKQVELLANHAGLLIESGKDIDQGLTTLNRLRLLSQDAAILKYVNTMSKVAEQKKMERKQ